MSTISHKKLAVVTFTLSAPAEIYLHFTRNRLIREIVDIIFTNRALSPLISSLGWRWYKARWSTGHLTILQTIVVNFIAGIPLQETTKFSTLRKAVLRMLYHASFQA